MKHFNIPDETLKEALHEINKYGEDPTIIIPELMRNNRIVAFGEFHFANNPPRDFGAAIMPKLKEAGATHLAIEAPTRIQSALNKYMNTGLLDPTVLPPLLRHKEYLNLLESARKNDIKILAVDLEKFGNSNYFARPIPLPSARNEIMAYNIDSILAKDPNSKIILWAGAGHLVYKNPKLKGVADLLRSKYNMATIKQEYAFLDSIYPLAELTTGINHPTIVPTNRAQAIAGFPIDLNRRISIMSWDYVLIFPKR
jgi:hypothetical protein